MATVHPRHFLVAGLFASLWLSLCPMPARSVDNQAHLAVIVARSSDMQSMDARTLRDIYLKKIFVDNHGHRIVPVNLPPERPLRRAFSASVIHMDEGQLQTYWNRQYFQGVSPPYVLGSQRAVVEFVARTPGALGYVQPCALDASVRVLMRMTLHGEGLQPCGRSGADRQEPP